MNGLPQPIRAALDRGVFCHIAARTPSGPHLTPMVFAVAGGRLWVTTSRTSVKARAWRSDARAAGLVRTGDDAVAFVGTVTRHDALEPKTWGRSIREAPLLALATARFTGKNARFFAGYAVDARRVPLAWMPPGRLFVELAIERAALVEGVRSIREWGEWPGSGGVPGLQRFRAVHAGRPALGALPAELRRDLAEGGSGALAVQGSDGLVVLPAGWAAEGASLYAVLPERTLALAGAASATPKVALGIDGPSAWRARHMVGAMARGDAEIFVADRLEAGSAAARRVAAAAGFDREGAAVVRIRPSRIVWWRGWSSGTVVA